jgi:hypothetical protein
MNKYKLLFDILKPKVGPDAARIIIYDVYDYDMYKYLLWYGKSKKIITDAYFNSYHEICSRAYSSMYTVYQYLEHKYDYSCIYMEKFRRESCDFYFKKYETRTKKFDIKAFIRFIFD